MTDITDITNESPKATLTLNTAPKADTLKTEGKPNGKPSRTRVATEPKKEVVEDDGTVWIKLVKGGAYGYKRAVYEQGKVYEVSKEVADHLLAQGYTVGGNGMEVVDVYYFQQVPKKKK